jgi:hypothetical protein
MTVQPTGVGDFTGTTAIVPADLLLDQQASVTIAAGSSEVFGPYEITSPSYAIAVDGVCNAAATLPILNAVVEWIDSATGLVVDQQTWYWLTTPQSPGDLCALTTGRGPTNADTVQITLNNFDPAKSVTIDYALWISSRIVTRHDWRMVTLNGLTLGYTEPLSNLQAGLPAWVAQLSLAANSSETWLCPLYSGQVQFTWQFGTATAMTINISAPLPDQAAANQPQLYNPASPAQAGTAALFLPRCPVYVKISNGNAAAENVRWSMTVLEYAS